HLVALNATVGQQLATSKRMQLWLSAQNEHSLTAFGLTLGQAKIVKALLGEMLPVTPEHIQLVKAAPLDAWVLKNQGEGGGHCLFGADILDKLTELDPAHSQAWAFMRRIHPKPRESRTFIARRGELKQVDDLIAEIGMFTVHFAGEPALRAEQGMAPTHALPHSTLNQGGRNPNSINNSTINDGTVKPSDENSASDAYSYAGYLIRSKSAMATEGGVHSGQGVLDSLMFPS
ncbi:MAG: glutathione synthase, partial [Shewanella sp.]